MYSPKRIERMDTPGGAAQPDRVQSGEQTGRWIVGEGVEERWRSLRSPVLSGWGRPPVGSVVGHRA